MSIINVSRIEPSNTTNSKLTKETHESQMHQRFKSTNEMEECNSSSSPPYQKRKILRNTVPDDCFGHCKVGERRSVPKRRQLNASEYPVSEYMDNVSRIGKVIMRSRIHEHKKKCVKRECAHPYVLDWGQKP